MFRLALLLIGVHALRRYWAWFVATGLVWLLAGAVIIVDLFDGVADIAVEILGGALLLAGLLTLVGAGKKGKSHERFDWFKGMTFVVAALLVLDFPWDNQLSFSLIFGSLFLVNGIWRALAAGVIRFHGWRRSLMWGIAGCVFALLILSSWPLPDEFNSRVVLGTGMILAGWSIQQLGTRIKRQDFPLGSMGLFRVPPPLRNEGCPLQLPPPCPAQHDTPLQFRVWTALATAENPRFLPVVNRYIATLSRSGKVSTGHAVLELAPDVYISHCPQDEIEVPAGQFARKLHAGRHNDMPGVFVRDYAMESAVGGENTFTVNFYRHDPQRLRAFWTFYRQDATYNLTDRNCSVAAILGLDAGIEGALAHRSPFWILLRLLTSTDLWLAAAIRDRAEAMVWTPGLALDYARLMQRILARLSPALPESTPE
ncbi:Uncharacterized membrane protein HdeD, DUF308 family [Formivibrio citricus]|uniref:Uncharacterized membrane protein HdeD, DUF308 family n=1 Tax=Formivibrio citricus TaxID=83765 RepID=A0A1I5BL47_9NEIS|nr:hypothetical protein [Formivibrio citricus]SFN75397.1 Uncharacterized membrane protein HdeD, DUF308 family [Formivibrio citricus]